MINKIYFMYGGSEIVAVKWETCAQKPRQQQHMKSGVIELLW